MKSRVMTGSQAASLGRIMACPFMGFFGGLGGFSILNNVHEVCGGLRRQ